MPGASADVDDPLVDALGVQVDLDRPAAARDAVEDRLPEVVAVAFRDAALAVDADRHAA